MTTTLHKAGFVSIVGKPNVGKSTLMNGLVGETLSVVTPKAQTTRHRIKGIISGEGFQIVYSDTPGLLEPQYELHKAMMRYVSAALEDADLILVVVDPFQQYDPAVYARLAASVTPRLVILNKADLTSSAAMQERAAYWTEKLNPRAVIAVSALKKRKLKTLLNLILEQLPNHPPYYPQDELTDATERFLAAEILREKIFACYTEEIPYSVAALVDEFKEQDGLIRIHASLFVERDSQKGILIGKGGAAMRKMATAARQEMETFFGKKIFLATQVRVAQNWRRNKDSLKRFGYLG